MGIGISQRARTQQTTMVDDASERLSMYLVEKITKDNERFAKVATCSLPFGPGFDEKTVSTCDTLEIWGTSFTDRSADCCICKLFRDGKLVGERKIEGY